MPSTRVRILTVSELSEYLHVNKATITECSEKENCRGFASEVSGGFTSTQSNSGSAIKAWSERETIPQSRLTARPRPWEQLIGPRGTA